MASTLYLFFFTSPILNPKKMERLFEGKVVLVTNAASAVGVAVAFSFAANGAFVVVSDIRDNGTANKIKANGGNAVFIKSNVCKAHECKRLVEEIASMYGRIDIAFNNANIVDYTINMIDTHLVGIIKLIAPKSDSVADCVKYEIALMRQHQGGVIINLSSLTGSISLTPLYTGLSHKQFVSGIQNEMFENSDKAIRINFIVPGFIDGAVPDSFNLKSKREISFGHKKAGTKTPEQVAELAMWLSSEKAPFSTRDSFPEYAGY